jgi:uncharacterized protein (DUF433 family)
MRISRPVAITALAATTLIGGVGGVMLLGPAGADAPDAMTTASATATSGPGDTPCPAGFAGVADTIGISTKDLRAALRKGQTIAEIAQAHGANPQDVIDALVADGTARLDRAVENGVIDQTTADDRKATLPDRAAKLVSGDVEGYVRLHPRRAVALRTVADTIGISTEDLRAALRDGQTIAQVTEAHGTDPQDVIDALVTRSTKRITRLVNGDTARQRC